MKNKLQLLFALPFLLIGYFFFQSFLVTPFEIEKVSEAYNALTFWAQVRAYPGKEIPEGKFISAVDKKETIRLNKSNLKITPAP